jgi:hypothetical protein
MRKFKSERHEKGTNHSAPPQQMLLKPANDFPYFSCCSSPSPSPLVVVVVVASLLLYLCYTLPLLSLTQPIPTTHPPSATSRCQQQQQQQQQHNKQQQHSLVICSHWACICIGDYNSWLYEAHSLTHTHSRHTHSLIDNEAVGLTIMCF